MLPPLMNLAFCCDKQHESIDASCLVLTVQAAAGGVKDLSVV